MKINSPLNPVIPASLWEMNEEQREHFARTRHMNGYSYAMHRMYSAWSQSVFPDLSIRHENVPSFLSDPLQKFATFSNALNSPNKSQTRIGVTLAAYEMFAIMDTIEKKDIDTVLQVLACVAYISIFSDKNDGYPFWGATLVRKISDQTNNVLEALINEMPVSEFVKQFAGIANIPGEFSNQPVWIIHFFIMNVMGVLIGAIENGLDGQSAAKVFIGMEKSMRDFERQYDIGSKNCFPGGICHHNQQRYRTTLYLYGGNHFERIGDWQKSFDWYTKDIYFFKLPRLLGNLQYLSIFRIAERFLSAHRLSRQTGIAAGGLVDILHDCIYTAFINMSESAREILNYISAHPEFDLGSYRINSSGNRDSGDIGEIHFAGEPIHEVFQFALMYHYWTCTDSNEIPYKRFLNFA